MVATPYSDIKTNIRQQCVLQVLQVLQCVAVCCSVLQCVAVCCSVLQCASDIKTNMRQHKFCMSL